MIDYEKSAKLNNTSVEKLRNRFIKFPQSNKKIVAICDECGKERELCFCDYGDLCKSCGISKRWESPEAREDHSMRLKKTYVENPDLLESKRGKNNPMYGKEHIEETKQKMSDNQPDKTGKNNPFYGKHHTEESKQKRLDNMPDQSGENSPRWNGGMTDKICEICGDVYQTYRLDQRFCSEKCYGIWYSENLVGESNSLFGVRKTEEHRIRISCSLQGIDVEDFNGFISFNPYCEDFNEAKKKEVREKYNNCDYLTGIHRDICNVMKNGKIWELAVHHFDYNKMQGCDGYKWKLVPVSHRHNIMFNKNRLFWEKLILYALEYDKDYYKVKNNMIW